MNTTSAGIHHITAITSDPQANLDFYEGFLGQRLVKRTVNFDDPRAYHFYFADAYGQPGTLLTFFYWKGIPKGTRGAGEVSSISYAVARDAQAHWVKRARTHDVEHTEAVNEFDEPVLRLTDPDGLLIELVFTDHDADAVSDLDWWKDGPVSREAMLHGFYGATLHVPRTETMEHVLSEAMGYKRVEKKGEKTRFMSSGDRATVLDVVDAPDIPNALQGGGSVHHIAFRASSDEEELELRSQVAQAGVNPTPVINREYFRSVYFRTPGGVLFEIATDGPGFEIDESREELGENLVLPPQFEEHRAQIERELVPITLPRDNQ